MRNFSDRGDCDVLSATGELISIHYKNGISQAVYRKMHIQSSMVDSVFIIYWISILAKVILRDAGLEPG
jgi:hypothetical protein